jgi:hypothetical protein
MGPAWVPAEHRAQCAAVFVKPWISSSAAIALGVRVSELPGSHCKGISASQFRV